MLEDIGLVAIGWGIVGLVIHMRRKASHLGVQSDAIGDILFGLPLGIMIGLTIGMVHGWISL